MRTGILLLLSFRLLALDNSIVVNEASGLDQSARPVTVPRVFSQGEIPNGFYPRPRINGADVDSWQVDVKNSWPDGSVMMAFISFHVSLTAGGSAQVDFVQDPNPCHLGNLATCQAAALSQVGMTGFDTGNGAGSWDFVVKGTANTISYSASARAMISGGAWSYWLRGPVVTRVLVEDVTRPNPAYDFGWEWDGSAWQAPSAEQYKSIHPMFMVSFYPGYRSGVEGEVIAESAWTSRLQRQVFDLEVQTYGGMVAYSKAAFDLPARSMFTRLVWSGTAPGNVQIDHNLKYLISTKILPPYDYRQSVPAADTNARLSSYSAKLAGDDPQSCSNTTYCGSWLKYIPQTGGRGDIALIPTWYMDALFTMGDPAWNVADRLNVWNNLLLGNADAGLTIPWRLRELEDSSYRDDPSDGRRYFFNYDSDATTPAWGRIVTVQSRPTLRSYSTYEIASPAADRVTPVCSTDPCDGRLNAATALKKGWTPDSAHWPSFFAIPYLLTGRYSYLLSLQETAGQMLMSLDPECYHYSTRCQEWGVTFGPANFRWVAWVMREYFLAAALSPDGPERVYFQDILQRNDAFYEGAMNVIGGNAQATGACAPTTSAGSFTATVNSSSGGDGNGAAQFKPNGFRKFFLTNQAPFMTAPTVKVNGITKTVGVRGVDSGKDWYYTPGGIVVWQDDAATPLSSSDTLTISYTGGKPLDAWCSGRHVGAKEQTGLLSWPWSSDVFTEGVGANSTYQYRGFHFEYWVNVEGWIRTSGAVTNPTTGKAVFNYYGQKLAEFVIGRFHAPEFEFYYSDQYTVPFNQLDGRIPKDWAEHRSMFDTESYLESGIDSSATTFVITEKVNDTAVRGMAFVAPGDLLIENEWVRVCSFVAGTPTGETTMTICPNGRGLYGSVASNHLAGAVVSRVRNAWSGDAYGHTYPNIIMCGIAMNADLSASNGTGMAAWEKGWAALANHGARAREPQWMIVPREQIGMVGATGTTGGLALRWAAASGDPCKVNVSELAPVGSSDSSDDDATVVSREQRYSTTGLQATTYRYRIRCGTAEARGKVDVH